MVSSGCFLTREGGRKSRFGVEDNEFGWRHIGFEVPVAHLSGAVHWLLGTWMWWNPGESPVPKCRSDESPAWIVMGAKQSGETAAEACVEREGREWQSWGEVTFKGQAEDEELQRQLKVSTTEAWGGQGGVAAQQQEERESSRKRAWSTRC